ncbi:VIT domain-containing protein [Verrucomicrobiales bacterium]|nr:VIT domain-containing protein [Verrucomicrobiales bacterium]
MMKWTEDAEVALNNYIAHRQRVEQEGFDADEVRADLRSHVEEELTSEGVQIVMSEAVRGILGIEETVNVAPEPVRKKLPLRRKWFIIFGIIAPLAVLVLEIFTGFCAGVFFDPLPSLWHVAVVALVPLAHWFVLRSLLGKGSRRSAQWAVFLQGVAVVVVVYYSLLFLPLLPIAFPAIIAWGAGFLPIGVIGCGWIAIRNCWLLKKSSREILPQVKLRKRLLLCGVLVGVVTLAAMELPKALGQIGMRMAVSDSDDTKANGLSLLRTIQPEESIRRVCYLPARGWTGGKDTVGWIFSLAARIDREQAREIYYRVTGDSFNTRPAPSGGLSSWRSSSTAFDDIVFETRDGIDDDLGGDNVGVRVAGLTLGESRLDAHIDPVSALAYQEWTMVFKNASNRAREARMQVLLPPLGVVSRLTLWVDGEEREAAFSTISRVKQAYQSIAVRERRDPVLVNVTGPDRIMVQCFPVPRNGEIKIRFGITAPLDRGAHPGRLHLPSLIERNFSIGSGLKHSVWVQSPDPLFSPLGRSGGGDLEAGDRSQRGHHLRRQLDHDDFQAYSTYVDCPTAAESAPLVTCPDPFLGSGEDIQLIRERTSTNRVPLSSFTIVLDGSSSLAPLRRQLVKALNSIPETLDIKVLLAKDDLIELGNAREAARQLGYHRFVGGFDNRPALATALDHAASTGGAVVWIHGPHPVSLPGGEALAQFFDRTPNPVPLYAIGLVRGPDRLLESLYRETAVHPGERFEDVAKDLPAFLQRLASGDHAVDYTYSESTGSDIPSGAVPVWDQLARYHGYEQVMDAFYRGGSATGTAELAATHQLVTPFSGAVVLETQAQFERFGLTPADAASVSAIPTIPEPSSAVLVFWAAFAALAHRRRPR